MAYEELPLFKQNYSDEYKLWRYITIPAFISILERRQVHFSRSDKLGDPYEGYLGIKGIEIWNKVFSKIPNAKRGPDFNSVLQMPKQQRQSVYVNCWHGNTYESMAMWKLYAMSGEGIAISTTVGSLKKCFKLTNPIVFIGKVKYIDHSTEKIDWDNVLNPFIHKNKCYEYEKEIRAIVWQPGMKISKSNKSKAGIYVDVSLDILIKGIYTSPLSPSWMRDVIISLCKKYAIDPALIKASSIQTPNAYY